MRRNDASADRQPEARPTRRRGPIGAGGAMELAKDGLLLPLRDALPFVRYLNQNLSIFRPGRDADRCSRGSMADGILEQVDENLLDQQLVNRHQRQRVWESGLYRVTGKT